MATLDHHIKRICELAEGGKKLSNLQIQQATDHIQILSKKIPGLEHTVQLFFPGGAWYDQYDHRTIDQLFVEALVILGYAPVGGAK